MFFHQSEAAVNDVAMQCLKLYLHCSASEVSVCLTVSFIVVHDFYFGFYMKFDFMTQRHYIYVVLIPSIQPSLIVERNKSITTPGQHAWIHDIILRTESPYKQVLRCREKLLSRVLFNYCLWLDKVAYVCFLRSATGIMSSQIWEGFCLGGFCPDTRCVAR